MTPALVSMLLALPVSASEPQEVQPQVLQMPTVTVTAKRRPPAPPGPYRDHGIDDNVWADMPQWQKEYVAYAVLEPAWRRARGVAEQSWARIPKPGRGKIILKALEAENAKRYNAEFNRLQVELGQLDLMQQNGRNISLERRRAFVRDVADLDERYPDAPIPNGRIEHVVDLERGAKRHGLQAHYLETHPADARFHERLNSARAAADAAKPDALAGKSALDRFYEATVMPQAHAHTFPRVPPAAADATRVRPAVQAAPKPQIRFEPKPPDNAAKAEAWRKAGGPEAERQYFETVMAGLVTPTERGTLERLARNQAGWETAKQEKLKAYSEMLSLYRKRSKDLKLPAIERAAMQQQIKNVQSDIYLLKRQVPEVIVSVTELENLAGRAYWDPAPGKDGKYRLRMEIDRGIVFTSDWKVRPTQVSAMKLFTHEFSHNADQADAAGMLRGLTERQANLNEARAYQEEGLPKGERLEAQRNEYNAIRRDPIAWTTEHLSHKVYIENGNLWSYLTPDDVRDPERGLIWRLKLAWHYGTERPAQRPALQLGGEAEKLLADVEMDSDIPDSDKPRVFAERAAKLEKGRSWVREVRATHPAEARRLEAAHERYWRDLTTFITTR